MKLAAFLLALLTLFGPTAEGTSGDKTIFLVRHAEKCNEPAGDPDLTEYGRQRAQDLTRVLMDVELDAIYSTPFKRTLNTALPLAQMHGVKIIETPAESGFMEAMVSRIKAGRAHNILISGHSNTTPVVVNLLGWQVASINDVNKAFALPFLGAITGVFITLMLAVVLLVFQNSWYDEY